MMLAGHLGMTVPEAQEKISSTEFIEWMAYFKIQPFGDRQATMNMAYQSYWSYVAMNGNQSVKVSDFDPGDESNKATTPEDMEALLSSVAKLGKKNGV